MPQTNQFKPLRKLTSYPPFDDCILRLKIATVDIIGPHILWYWKLGMTDVEILDLLKRKYIDPEQNGIG